MSRKQLKLTDIIETAHLQQLQDSLAAVADINIALYDIDGKKVTHPVLTKHPEGCLSRAENGEELAILHILRMIEESRKNDQPFMNHCPETHSFMAVVPFLVDNMFLGCCVVERPRKRAAPENYEEEFNRFFQFLESLNLSVMKLAHANLEMAQKDRAIEALDHANEIFRRFIDASNTAMYICDWDTGEILMANQAYCNHTRRSMEEVQGQICWEICGIGERRFRELIPESGLDRNTSKESESWVYYNEKKNAWLQCTNHLVPWSDDRRTLVVTLQDISKERALREELAYLAYYDSATNLPNSQKLIHDIHHITEKANKEKAFISEWLSARKQNDNNYRDTSRDIDLVCFDLSVLRQFIDAYGRNVSDELMKSILHWCHEQEYCRWGLYRLDNYEFCMLLYGQTDEYVKEAAQQLYERFIKPWQILIAGQESSYLCSVSVSVIYGNDTHVENADMLMLISRTLETARRTNRVFFYDEKMDAQAKENIRLELSLKTCVTNDMQGFDLHFHPIVELSSGMWKGLEALCRWESPEMGRIPPDRFIREAERLGLIGRLGEWVLETGIRRSKELKLDEIEGYFISINISPIQMMDDTFADNVIALLKRYDYPGKKLNLEVTESAEMTFNQFTMNMIEMLRGYGVKLSLDDFGTGYSSFNNLKNMPVSFLKTERDFIGGIEHDSYMQYFFYIMSEIAHANDMKLIAEGIETAKQLEIVKNNGADYIQGYFFSKPLPFENLKEKLHYFNQMDPAFLSLPRQQININQWLSGQNAYIVTPNLFKVLNQCMELILSTTDINAAFDEVLAIIGKHFDVGRAFAYGKGLDGKEKQIYEWCSESAFPMHSLFDNAFVDEMDGHSMPFFRKDGMVVTSDIQTLPEAFRKAFQGQAVQSFVVLPMWDKEQLIGVVGFDDYRRREWSPEEIILLWNLCMIMANVVKGEQLKTEVDVNKTLLMNMLNNTGVNAFVSDIDTHEILWVNDAAAERYGKDIFQTGRKCYEVLQGNDSPCQHCHLPELVKNPELKQITLEHHSDVLGRTFMVYHTLIPWEGRGKAHAEYFIDITEQSNIEKKLAYFATTDTLTSTTNRSTIMEQLVQALSVTQNKNQPLSIAVTNTNGVKMVNQEYGHPIGDRLLENVAEAIKSCIRGGDLIGRVGGDEFLVVLPNCDKDVADARMREAQQYLQKMEAPAEGISMNFCYGIAEVSEVDTLDCSLLVDKLLAIAEERLREAKKRFAKEKTTHTQDEFLIA